MKTRETKRHEAEVRTAAWRAFTIDQRLLMLALRPGKSLRQHKKLSEYRKRGAA